MEHSLILIGHRSTWNSFGAGSRGGPGGTGGGIVYILASTINFSGTLRAKGGNGVNGINDGGGDGPGSGGSIRIEGADITFGTLDVSGGSAGGGGLGRVAIYYSNSFSNSATNSNMTCRMESGVVYLQDYNAENRISAIYKLIGECSGTASESWIYTYDGDGVRVSTAHFTAQSPIPQIFTAYYMGGSFEVTGSLDVSTFTETGAKSYYIIAGMTVAMKDSSGVKYLLTDHLGSVAAVVSPDGNDLDTELDVEQQRYLPFGGARTISDSLAITSTDFTYTGQRDLPGTGMMDYKARFYSPYINLNGLRV